MNLLPVQRVTNPRCVGMQEPCDHRRGGTLSKYKTPEEAGIARLPSSTPKRNRPKTDPSRRKWITKGEAKAKGYSL